MATGATAASPRDATSSRALRLAYSVAVVAPRATKLRESIWGAVRLTGADIRAGTAR